MKNLLATTFIWLCACFATSYAQSSSSIAKDIFREWTTIRLVLEANGSDYSLPGKYLLLQHLDSSRVVLSSRESDTDHGFLPAARALISAGVAQKIVDQAVKCYFQAQEETRVQDREKPLEHTERGDPIKRHDPATTVYSIRIEVLVEDRSFDFHDDFADDSLAGLAFSKLFDPAALPKTQ